MIAVDLDNVIAKTDPKIRQIIQSISGVSLSQHDIQAWDYAEALIVKGLDRSAAQKITAETFDRFHGEHCSEVEPVEGAVESILKLYEAGSKIVIVTGRSKTKTCEELTRRWLRSLSIPDSWLMVEDNKASVCSIWSSLIDDAPHQARDVAEAGIRVYLFDYPWNKDVRHRLVTRVSGWDDATALILKDRLLKPNRE